MLHAHKIAVKTTGVAGAAQGDGYSDRPINGEVQQVLVDWNAAAPATSDLTVIAEGDAQHPAVTLYAKQNAVADVNVYPTVQGTDTGGVALAGVYQNVFAHGRLKVSVAQSNALDPAVTVYVYVKE